MQAGGMGWGHAKEALFEVINEHLKEQRTEFEKLRADEGHLLSVLDQGAKKAFEVSEVELGKLREALGFRKQAVAR